MNVADKFFGKGCAVNHRHQKGMRWFKHVMLLAGSFAAFKFVFAFLGPNAGGKAAEAVAILIGSLFLLGLPAYVLGWLTEKNDGTESPANSPVSETLYQAPSPPVKTPVFDEDRAYQSALEEINNNQTHPALWARAIAESDGLESKARAVYIRLRVERLSKES